MFLSYIDSKKDVHCEEDMGIDVSSLDLPVTDSEIEAYREWANSTRPQELSIFHIVLFSIIIFLSVFTVAFTATILNHQNNIGSFVIDYPSLLKDMVIPLLVMIVIILIGAWSIHASREREKKIELGRARLLRFASVNHGVYEINASSRVLEGMIFKLASLHSISEVITFPDGMKIGQLSTRDNDDTNRLWFFVTRKLPRSVPHLILDAKSNNFLGTLRSIPHDINGGRLSLEGDFDKHFSLFTPKGYERDALYIFTPDVMHLLIEHGRYFDVEIIDDTIIFFSPRNKFGLSGEAISDAIKASSRIEAKLSRQAGRYIDDRKEQSHHKPVRISEPELLTRFEKIKLIAVLVPVGLILFVGLIAFLVSLIHETL